MTRALSTRDAVLVVARREFVERARDRSFLVSTGVTLAIIAAVVALPELIGLGDTTYRVAVTGHPDALLTAARAQAELSDVGLEIRSAADSSTAREAVADGEVDTLVDRGTVVVERELPAPLRAVLDNAHQAAAGDAALAEAGLDPAEVARALAVPPLQVETLDPDAEAARTRGQIAFVGALVLYGQLLGYGFWEAALSRVLAVTPPVSALTMPVRSARGDAAPWEAPLAVGLMLGLIVVLVVVAGRIYEGAVLRTGSKVALGEAWRSGRRR